MRPLSLLLAVCVLGTASLGAAAASAQAAHSGYRIEPALSTVVYAMSHPGHDWTGTSRSVTGTLAAAPSGAIMRGTVSAPVTSFDSGNRSRDSNMIEATEAYVHRNVTFQIARLAPLATPTAAANAVAEGTMTFHGVRQPLRIPVRLERTAAGGLRVRGTFDVTLTQFGIAPPRLLGIAARDWIGLTLDLVARPL